MKKWSGRPDLNRRPWAPDAHALTKLRHAPITFASQILAKFGRHVNGLSSAKFLCDR